MGYIEYFVSRSKGRNNIVKICKKEAGKIHPIIWVASILFILNFVLLAVI